MVLNSVVCHSTLTPDRQLGRGQWVKLICGASYQDLPAIRNLALVYTLAGVDCVDLAADPAVVTAAQAGITMALSLSESFGTPPRPHAPWLMVSLNDGEDPHFRKAEFDPSHCPVDCPRPCASVCPTAAIAALPDASGSTGVTAEKCYGCGRCLPICPWGLIETRAQTASVATLLPWLQSGQIAAIEVHTQVGHAAQFHQLWETLRPSLSHLKAIAISCPFHPDGIAYLQYLNQLIQPLPIPVIWQADGRPMSGDIGRGTTHTCIHYGEQILQAHLPGYVQLAGGTNAHTINKVQQKTLAIHGVAFGSCARTLLSPLLHQAELRHRQDSGAGEVQLETYPDLLHQAIALAQTLVSPWKNRSVIAP
ncbi:MAG: LdpA C-terminal domain-containing domain [Synechocystis sp.]|nr:LdpA C-terminal domain-containing domain [Synechocystis sp.]